MKTTETNTPNNPSISLYINQLDLSPHPEGGFYKETYRSTQEYLFSPDFHGLRNVSTAIYFMLLENNFSAFHKIKSDETWHFYAGDALEVIELSESKGLSITLLGNQLDQNSTFQHTVYANTWFASRVKSGGTFSLVGCTVAPGFDFNDFVMADRAELIKLFPQHQVLIESLTRK